jgi:general secretion pathway protein K
MKSVITQPCGRFGPARRLLRDRRGVALLLVLWVLAFLSIVVAEFCRTMRTEAAIAYNYRQMTQAAYSARAGVHMALLDLVRNPALTAAAPGPLDSEDWRINVDIPATGPDRQNITIRIDNEGGKVNINLADAALLRLAVTGLGLTDEEKDIVVDSILDWRDKDDAHRPNGAENDYYQALPTPYPCKNGDFDAVSELLLVRGVTPALFHGGLARRVTVHPSRATAEKQLGLKPGATQLPDGFDFRKISINAASPELLRALPEWDDEMVEAVVAFRQAQDIRSASEMVTLIGPKAYLTSMQYLDFKVSPYFTVTAFGEMDDGTIRQGVGAVVRVDLKSRQKYDTVQWLTSVAAP